MNRELKKFVLIALFKGVISKVEAWQLLRTDGIIHLDLSSQLIKQNPPQSLLEKIPELKNHFIRIISLGHGKNPSK